MNEEFNENVNPETQNGGVWGNTEKQYGTPDYGNANQQYVAPDYGNANQQYGTPDYGNANQQYGNPNYGNTNQQYGNPNYGNAGEQYGNPNYGQASQKGQGIGLGIASLVLGILSILLFLTCLNFILGLVAIVLGIIQIVKNQKKGMAITGIVTAVVSFVLTILVYIGVFAYIGTDDFQDLYNQYYEENSNDYESTNVQEMDCPFETVTGLEEL